MAAENLSVLFNQNFFRIPDYQRGYAWVDKQLTELWDDIDEIQKNEEGEFKHHYTGTIYLEKTKPDKDEDWLSGVTFYNVVDGQQRLTTISILLFELLRVTKNGYCGESKEDLEKKFIVKMNRTGASKVYRFGYSKTCENTNYFLNKIMEDGTTVLDSGINNVYTKNLAFAKKFFRDKILMIDEPAKEVLFKKVTASLLFDMRAIEKDLDVQAVFETMNNRGKPLSTLEKLKNRLIYLTEKLSCANEDRINLRKKINEAWGIVYTWLAKNEDHILDEDIFLSAHLSLYRKPQESTFSERHAEEKVFQMFCNKAEKYYLNHLEKSGEMEDKVSYSKIEHYVLSIAQMAPVWYMIHNSNTLLIKKVLAQNSSKDLKIFLAGILLKSPQPKSLNEILVAIERILFRNRISGIGVMDERTLSTWARALFSNEETLESILAECEKLLAIPVNSEIVVQFFQSLFRFVNNPKGFYRWSNLKYFIFEYEELLQTVAKETDPKVTLDSFNETTIEHIIPQSFLTHWEKEVFEVVEGLEGEEKAQAEKVLINTLGNLTILKGGKNTSLGCKSWEEKLARFRTGSYNEIDVAKNTKWTKSEICCRGLKMLELLERKIQGMKFSAEQKNLILFYDDPITTRMLS